MKVSRLACIFGCGYKDDGSLGSQQLVEVKQHNLQQIQIHKSSVNAYHPSYTIIALTAVALVFLDTLLMPMVLLLAWSLRVNAHSCSTKATILCHCFESKPRKTRPVNTEYIVKAIANVLKIKNEQYLYISYPDQNN